MFLFQHSASQHGNKGKYVENVRMYLKIVSANTLPQPPTRGEKNAPFVGSAPHRAIVADPQPNNTRRDLSLSRQNKEVSIQMPLLQLCTLTIIPFITIILNKNIDFNHCDCKKWIDQGGGHHPEVTYLVHLKTSWLFSRTHAPLSHTKATLVQQACMLPTKPRDCQFLSLILKYIW